MPKAATVDLRTISHFPRKEAHAAVFGRAEAAWGVVRTQGGVPWLEKIENRRARNR